MKYSFTEFIKEIDLHNSNCAGHVLIIKMGNCEGTTVKGNHEFTPTQIGDKVWSINYKHDNVEVEGNIAKCAEHDEPGLALLKVPAKEQEIMRFRVYFNPEAASLGIGIFDLDIVKHTDFSG